MKQSCVIPDTHMDIVQSKALACVAHKLPNGLLANNLVSFLWADDRFHFSTLKSYHKYQCLLADPCLTALIVDPQDPRRYLELRGQAGLADDVQRKFIDSVAAKYFGLEHYPFDKPGDERVTVTLELARVRAVNLDAHDP
ncbi:MAG: PPOX class F420-dependent oxidoreductase [Gammaproteobacteria bacterium]|nr:PPOX class F420-dependent oxidoreductase [Gammaproteobacteria bacterium]